MRTLDILMTVGLALSVPSLALAQGDNGVANSGMSQGEARIASRSDIRLSMESMPGTGAGAVSALGTRVGQHMPALRTCYADTVAENPSITGTLRMRVLIEARGRPNIEVDRDGVNDRTLVRCITRVLETLSCDGLRRPTHAVVQLELANSAAAGAEQARERATEAQQVAVTIGADGNPSTSGGTPDGVVLFTTHGQGRNAVPAVTAAHRTLIEAFPGLMDCRRRAGRSGMNQTGTLAVTMRIQANRTAQSVVGRTTIQDERAGRCVRGVLQRTTHRPEAGAGTVRVEIEFAVGTRVADP